MGRPRTKDTHLPPRVYRRNGAYYHVERGKWTRLGPDFKALPASAGEIKPTLTQEHLRDYCYRVLARARANAKGRRKIAFSLTRADIDAMLLECDWRCAVTGAPFSMDVMNGRKPFAPSIDRRDNGQGYTRENCRLVCVAANFAMNTWGEGIFEVLMPHYRTLQKRKALDSFGR